MKGELSDGVTKHMLNAGSEVLYEGVAEAFEPDWQEILTRIYLAMNAASQERDT